MRRLSIDFETYSAIPIKLGSYRYADDPSTEVLMMAYSFDFEPVKMWVKGQPFPQEVKDAFADDTTLIYAHNVGFEIPVTRFTLSRQEGVPVPALNKWRCTMAMCLSLAIPSSLEKAAEFLKIPVRKDRRGKALIRKFSIPSNKGVRTMPEDDPEAYDEFIEYCRQDVVVQQGIEKKLSVYELSEDELKVFLLHLNMNERGIPVDFATIEKAITIVDAYTERESVVFSRLTKGLKPTMRDAVLNWVKDQGVELPNLQAGTIDSFLESGKECSSKVRRVLQIRRSVGSASVKKLYSMRDCICPSTGRIHGALQYHGASTGRTAGRLIQIQNYPRPTLKNTGTALNAVRSLNLEEIELLYDPMDAVISCLRHMIHVEDGYKLVVADYSAIEARVVAFLAGQKNVLQEYLDGEDLYKTMAAFMYKVPVSEVTGDQRQIAKAAVLGCGFGMSARGFKNTCDMWGIPITKKEAQFAVNSFRAKYDMVARSWDMVGNAAKRCVQSKQRTSAIGLTFEMERGFLFMTLPNGRKLSYPRAKVKMITRSYEDDDGNIKKYTTDSVVFEGYNAQRQWVEQATYGGKLFQNAVQAIARDMIMAGSQVAEEAGYLASFMVHDETVTIAKKDTGSVEEFENLLCVLPEWADGCPVAAEGYEDIMYRK